MEFAKLPQHIAFIMDGNGRWATGRGLQRLQGHKQGVNALETVVKELQRLEIPYATFYAFSTENWRRSEEEVSGLFNLMRAYFTEKKIKELIEKGIRIRFMGNRTPAKLRRGGEHLGPPPLADDLIDMMNTVEQRTQEGHNITLNFAINYSGRDELVRAMQFFAEDVVKEMHDPWEMGPDLVKKYLDTSDIPDPDVIIRTSGEHRISNFMLWQMAYAELVFHPTAWPEFGVDQLHDCLQEYIRRDRRFGGVMVVDTEDELDDGPPLDIDELDEE